MQLHAGPCSVDGMQLYSHTTSLLVCFSCFVDEHQSPHTSHFLLTYRPDAEVPGVMALGSSLSIQITALHD